MAEIVFLIALNDILTLVCDDDTTEWESYIYVNVKCISYIL